MVRFKKIPTFVKCILKISPLVTDRTIYKSAPSAFDNAGSVGCLQNNTDELIIAGKDSHHCHRNTILSVIKFNFDVTVMTDWNG